MGDVTSPEFIGPRLLDTAGSSGPNRIYSARELLRRVEEPGPFHNFPEVFNDDIFQNGTRTVISDNYVQYTLRGEINLPGSPIYNPKSSIKFDIIQLDKTTRQPSLVNIGETEIIGYTPSRTVPGTFEIGVKPSKTGKTEVIVHRFFNPDE